MTSLTSRKQEFALGSALSTVALGLATLPAAWRASVGTLGAAGDIDAGFCAWLCAWLCSWGASALLLGPLGGVFRSSWPFPRAYWVAPVALFAAGLPLAVFAEILRRTTHHRPLGAATFALIGAVLVAGVLALSARVMLGQRVPAIATWAFRLMLAGSALGIVVWLGRLVLAENAVLRWGLVDAALLLSAVLAALLPVRWALPPNGARWVAACWGAVVITGFAMRSVSPPSMDALEETAPVVLGVATCLES